MSILGAGGGAQKRVGECYTRRGEFWETSLVINVKCLHYITSTFVCANRTGTNKSQININ